MRSLITSLGIFLGVASLLANLAFVRAMDNDVRKNLEQIGGLSIVTIKKIDPTTKKERIKFQQTQPLTVSKVQNALENFRFSATILPKLDLHWKPIRFASKEGWARVSAAGESHQDAYNYTIGEGRWLSDEEASKHKAEAVIGLLAAERVFGKGIDPLDKEVVFNGKVFKIVGTIKTGDKFDRRAMEFFVNYYYYVGQCGGANSPVGEVAVKLSKSEDAPMAAREIRTRIASLSRGIENISVETNGDKINEMKAAGMGMKILLLAIAAISLLVGGISIMNIMFATIGDRIREIGIRKALGARKDDILMQFLIEAVLVCFVGGIPGMFLGGSVTLFPPGIFPFVPALALSDYLLALGFTLAAGFLAGLFPALRAANMQPIEALRF